MAIWLTTSIWSNRLKLMYLISLIPSITVLALWAVLLFEFGWLTDEFYISFASIAWALLPILLLWLIIWVYFQRKIIFWFTWARAVTRREEPEIYNIVENLCISRGLPTPNIGIIESQGLNAFATGWSKKDSWVVFTRGLLQKLDTSEIEAVAAHELAHIINEDVKHMVIINVFIWAISTIWYILLRTWGWSGWRSRGWGSRNPLPLIGLALYLVWVILLPLVNLAISRRKEYLADAWAVQLTRNRDAMIGALQKISGSSYVSSVEDKGRNIASMFIHTPRQPQKHFFNARALLSTHPSIESRIDALRRY